MLVIYCFFLVHTAKYIIERIMCSNVDCREVVAEGSNPNSGSGLCQLDFLQLPMAKSKHV